MEQKNYDAYIVDLLKSLYEADSQDCRLLCAMMEKFMDESEPSNISLLCGQIVEVVYCYGVMKRPTSFIQNVPRNEGGDADG